MRLLQPRNASSPMYVTPFGMTTEARFARHSELVASIPVTLCPSISDGITTDAETPHEAMDTRAPPSSDRL